jgi:hypothetical protein
MEDSHCSLIDFTMHWIDGSKKEATSVLRKDIVGREIMLEVILTQEASTAQIEY